MLWLPFPETCPMRFTLAILCLALVSQPAMAQQKSVTLQVDFAQQAAVNEAAIGGAFITKAWTDSVDIYLNAEMAQRGPSNLVRVPTSGNYRLLVQSIPLMAGSNPTGTTAYSLIFFRPPNVGSNWQYITSEIGYTRSAREAAAEMLRMVVSALR